MGNIDNLKPFKKGQSGNPKGRPKANLGRTIDELATRGFKRVPRAQVVEAYEALIGVDRETLKELKEDATQPAIVGLVASALLDKAKGFQILETMLDRAHGKATIKSEVEHSGKIELPAWLSGEGLP